MYRFSIGFDPNGIGIVKAEHPIIPGLTPPFSKEADMARRSAEGESGIALGVGQEGGLHEIESGYIHRELKAAGLEHSPVYVRDLPVNSKEPFGAKFRASWVNFKKK